jgi:integrase
MTKPGDEVRVAEHAGHEGSEPQATKRPARKRDSGDGSLRLRPDGRWEGRFHVPSGTGRQRRSVFGKTRAEAREKLRSALNERDRGVAAVPARETVATYLETWLSGARSTIAPRTFQAYESSIRVQLIPRLGPTPLARLRPQHVQRMQSDMLAEGLSPKTIRNVHGVLHRALERAVKWHQLAANPCDGVDLPRRQRREMTALTAEQARIVLAAAQHDDLGALFVLALTTGMRQGELLALRWRDVDLDAGRLAVVASSVRLTPRARALLGVEKAEPVRGEPKTARSRRVVELPAVAVEALRRHREATKVVDVNGQVFTRPDGRILAVPHVWSRWRRLLERAGVPTVRFHDARHTVATLLLGSGVHPKLVSEMLGHSTVGITLDTYSHVTATMHREAARALDGLLSASAAR